MVRIGSCDLEDDSSTAAYEDFTPSECRPSEHLANMKDSVIPLIPVQILQKRPRSEGDLESDYLLQIECSDRSNEHKRKKKSESNSDCNHDTKCNRQKIPRSKLTVFKSMRMDDSAEHEPDFSTCPEWIRFMLSSYVQASYHKIVCCY